MEARVPGRRFVAEQAKDRLRLGEWPTLASKRSRLSLGVAPAPLLRLDLMPEDPIELAIGGDQFAGPCPIG